MKLPKSICLMAAPILFFILFLHPFYLVTFFENNTLNLGIFRATSLATSLAGVVGIVMYLKSVYQAIKHHQVAQPSLWFQAPLAIASTTVIIKFLLPILK